MTYSDSYNIRTTSVKFNDVADAIDGVITRSNGGTTTGTSSAYIVTPTPAWNAYYTNSFIIIIPHVTNSAGATINISGLGAKNITRGGSNITAGSMPAGFPVFLSYTGTTFEAGFVTAGAVAADGSVPMTADLNFGGYKPINIAAGTASVPAICAGNDVDTGIFSPAANTWAVSTGTLERIRVDSNGQLGIGTSSPAATVDVQSTATEVRVSRFSNDSTGSVLGLYKSKGTNVGVNTLISNGDTVGSIEFRGGDGTDYDACARISAAIDGTPGSGTDMPGRLMFFTTPDGSATPTERMRIDKDGNVGIGTDAPQNSIHIKAPFPRIRFEDSDVSGIYALVSGNSSTGDLSLQADVSNAAAGSSLGFHVDGTQRMWIYGDGRTTIGSSGGSAALAVTQAVNLAQSAIQAQHSIASAQNVAALVVSKFDNTNTTSQIFARFYINDLGIGSGQINANGANACAFGTFSDIRLKENITDLPSQLANILALRPVEFDYKDGSGHQIGFIAQEVQGIYPDLVGQDENGMLTLTALSKNEARLVKAIQELNAKVEALESEIATLKSQGA